MIARWLLAAVMMGAAACGDSVTSPSPPPATLTYLTLSPQVGMVLIGRPLQLTANGVFSDGSARRVSASFRSDSPQRATVSGQGLVSAQQPGTVTISAISEGKSATLVLEVLPDFSGQWEGAGRTTACQGNADQCALTQSQPVVGIAAFVDQIDRRIRVLLVINGVPIRYQTWADGTITDAGEMMVSGGSRQEVLPGRFLVTRVTNWRSTVSETGTMAGSASAEFENSVSLPPTTHHITVAFDGLQRIRAGASRHQDSNRF